MQYAFALSLIVKEADIQILDRTGNALQSRSIVREEITEISCLIPLPNLVQVVISKKALDSKVELKTVSLGHLTFNNAALEKLFVYHHELGTSRSKTWDLGGRVEFELFELSAIKYHLIMGTRI